MSASLLIAVTAKTVFIAPSTEKHCGKSDLPANVPEVNLYPWLTDKTFRLAVETAATRAKSACADCWNP